MLKDLIVSRVRIKILKLYLLQVGRIFHLREIQRQTGEAMNAIRREMNHLKTSGFFTTENRGNRIYFRFREDHLLYSELLRLFNKVEGLGHELIQAKTRIGKIKFAMLSGRFIKALTRDKSDVDLFIVGQVVFPELTEIIKKAESQRGQEINYTVMNEDEFVFRKKRRDPFVLKILQSSRLMLIGDEEELLR